MQVSMNTIKRDICPYLFLAYIYGSTKERKLVWNYMKIERRREITIRKEHKNDKDFRKYSNKEIY